MNENALSVDRRTSIDSTVSMIGLRDGGVYAYHAIIRYEHNQPSDRRRAASTLQSSRIVRIHCFSKNMVSCNRIMSEFGAHLFRFSP
jgi:hypothetical protein